MKILITGGTGFIGTYLTDRLFRLGHEVFVYDKHINFTDNLSYYRHSLKLRQHIFTKKPAKRYPYDIRSKKHISYAMNDSKAEIVVHLAAISNAKPHSNFTQLLGPINLGGALNVFQAFEEAKHSRRIIFPSSSFAYGNYIKNPQPEDSPLKPLNEYGIMKAACEYALQLSKKEWVILRPTSVYGFTDCANRVTQLLFDAALANKPAWVVRGEELDFTYILDAVDGFVKAITRPGANREIFNISRGKARTAEDFANAIKKYFPNFQFAIKEPSGGIINRGSMDISKAKKILGFVPHYDIEDGIADTFRLMKKYEQI